MEEHERYGTGEDQEYVVINATAHCAINDMQGAWKFQSSQLFFMPTTAL